MFTLPKFNNLSILLRGIIVFSIPLIFGCRKTVVDPFIDIIPNYPVVNITNFGAIPNDANDDSQAIAKAIEEAHHLKVPVFIPKGRFKASIQLSHDDIVIVGQKQPSEKFLDGTIIEGKIDCNYRRNVHIQRLGIDARNQLGDFEDAALTSGKVPDTMQLNQHFSEISIIGDGYTDFKHGILCQAGTKITMNKIIVKAFYHGIAIRSSNVQINSVKAIACGFTSVVVKSDVNKNSVTENVWIKDIDIIGHPTSLHSRGGMVMIMSNSNHSVTRKVFVNNVKSLYGGIACIKVQQVAGVVSDVVVKNCSAKYLGGLDGMASFDVEGGANIEFINCGSEKSSGYAFKTSGSVINVSVINGYEIDSKIQAWEGNFKYLKLNGRVVIQ